MTNRKSLVVSMYNSTPGVIEVINKLFMPSIIKNAPGDIQLILIDDASPLKAETKRLVDAHRPALEKAVGDFAFVRNPENLGFAGSYNLGMKMAEGDVVLIANDDVYFPKDSIQTLCDVAGSDPNIAAVGPVTNYAHSFQCTGLFGKINDFSDKELQRIEDFSAWLKRVMSDRKIEPKGRLIGFCLAMPKQVLEEVGYFDERYRYGMFEDADLIERMTNSGRSVILDASTFVEHGGPTGGSRSIMQNRFKATRAWAENLVKYGKKWGYPQLIKDTARMMIQYPFDLMTITKEIKSSAIPEDWEEYKRIFSKD